MRQQACILDCSTKGGAHRYCVVVIVHLPRHSTLRGFRFGSFVVTNVAGQARLNKLDIATLRMLARVSGLGRCQACSTDRDRRRPTDRFCAAVLNQGPKPTSILRGSSTKLFSVLEHGVGVGCCSYLLIDRAMNIVRRIMVRRQTDTFWRA